MPTEIAVQLLQILGPVAVSVVTYAAHCAAMYFAARTKSQNLSAAVGVANDAVTTVVGELEQTMVAQLKTSSGGTLTGEDIEKVKSAALDKAKSYMGPKGVELVAKAMGIKDGDLGKWLQGKIEAAVGSMQPGANPVLPPFNQGTPGITVYNQTPGEVQADGSTSRGLPPFGGMTPAEKTTISKAPPAAR